MDSEQRGVAAAILLGGGSRRMGRDKATVPVGGRALLLRVLDAIARTDGLDGAVTLVGTDRVRFDDLVAEHPLARAGRLRTIPDREPDGGPFLGLATALTDARGHADTLLVVPVDHPALEPSVLGLLVSRLRTDAVVLGHPSAPDGDPSVLAVRTEATGRLDAAVAAGERRLHGVFDHLDVEVLPPAAWRAHDPLGATLVDVDDEPTRREVEAWLRRRDATAPAERGLGGGVRPVVVTTVRDGRSSRADDRVIVEEPLEIRVHGPGQEPTTVVTTMRTPGHEPELAVGWLLAEGLIGPWDVAGVSAGDPLERARPDDVITVRSRVPVDLDAPAQRHATATASCGVCGRASIDALAARITPIDPATPRTAVAWEVVRRLPDELRLAQPAFAATGGVHAAGLADHAGRLVTVREDVGRHNAFDAVIGAHALGGVWPEPSTAGANGPGDTAGANDTDSAERADHASAPGLADLVAVLSGRIGFELVAKAAAAGIPVVVAVGAASDLAVRTADRLGVTLVGFVRGHDATIYTHPHRIALP